MADYTKQIFDMLGVVPRERFKLEELPNFTFFIERDLTVFECCDAGKPLCRDYGHGILINILNGVFHIAKEESEKVMNGDTKHIIVEGIYLKGNAKLHRFENAAGIQYSAIYTVGGREVYSCVRDEEARMIAYWNNSIF